MKTITKVVIPKAKQTLFKLMKLIFQGEVQECRSMRSIKSKNVDSQTKFAQQNQTIDQMIEKNSQYYDHISGNCLCAKCTCGKHKCKCNCKPSGLGKMMGKTNYQEEYSQKQKEIDDIKPKKNNFFDQKLPSGRIEAQTIYQHDYPGYNSKGSKSQKIIRPQTPNVPFSGMSTYQNMFLNWGIGDTAQLVPQNNPTTIKEMPFMGRSVYKDSFQGNQQGLTQSFKPDNTLKSPLSPPNLPFTGESIAKSSFKPFKTSKARDSNQNIFNIGLKPSYNGQYNSIYMNDFKKRNLAKCPAQVILDQLAESQQNK